MQTTTENFSEQRKLCAVMFADMAGYTAMMQEDEAKARILRQRQRNALETLIPAYHGTIVQYFGDGTLALFASSADCVRCGISLQQELQKEPKVKLRIGIHSGDVVHEKEGIYGDCINLASRIESISVPGAVLFSARIHEEIKNQQDILVKKVGKFHFKNVKEPTEVYAAANEGLVIPATRQIRGKIEKRSKLSRLFQKKEGKLIALGIILLLATLTIAMLKLFPVKTNQNSIAILPLENLSGDPAQDFFVSGMHETLISELSKISSLKVISRTSMMQYKDTRKSIPQIANELDVNLLLAGAVLREADKVRITVQLIDGSTDKHVWSKEFDRDLRSILALYSEVAQRIADEIELKLTPRDQERLVTRKTVDPKAYEFYLLGRHHWSQRTLRSYELAIENFKQALNHDSSFAPAYAALADCYLLSGEQGGIPQQEARLLANNAIQKSLELNPELAEAHASHGVWKLSYEWNWQESENSFKKAIELNPGYATAYQWYGRTLGFIGRNDEALIQLEKARELDPLSPIIPAYIGQVLLFAKKYQKSKEILEVALQTHPNHALILHNIGELFVAEGRYAEAIAPLRQSAELSTSFHYKAMLALAYAKAKRNKEALNILNELENAAPGTGSPFNISFVYLGLGNKEQALEQLEKAYDQRDVWMKELHAWPWFDELKHEPRFKALIRKMNFPG